jgi:succinate dehydrogenase / fumarate reductase membrane anchor subunit
MSARASRDYRTPRARVEGLGAARNGTTHFLHQRITAVALVPLSIWFVFAALELVGNNLAEVMVFLAEPLNTILMFGFLTAALYHMSLGMQIVIEDYVHREGVKIVLLILNRLAMWAIGGTAGFALLKIAI